MARNSVARRKPFRLDLGEGPCRILCLGAHSDDIEIGCGGTILRLTRSHPNIAVSWVVFGADEQRAWEAQESAAAFLHNAQEKTVIVKGFRDSYFPYQGSEIKDYFEALKLEIVPDVIFTHYRGDLHQDHRVVADLTWNTFRRSLILEYEIPKYDADLGSPNLYVELDEATCQEKAELIAAGFQSQQDKHWFTRDTFLALPRLRGIESNSLTRYAEAFYCRKMAI